MDSTQPPFYYLFDTPVAGMAVAAHLDLEVLKQCAVAQAFTNWVIRDGKSLDSNVVAVPL